MKLVNIGVGATYKWKDEKQCVLPKKVKQELLQKLDTLICKNAYP